MTRKERENAIRCLKLWIEREPYLQTYKICLEALEQESCDKYIKEIDHLRKYISKLETQIVEQQHCEDCISREQAIKQCGFGMTSLLIADCLQRLPHVAPQPKIGKWISHYDENAKEGWYECDRCHTERAFNTDYCPDCGAKMEVEE